MWRGGVWRGRVWMGGVWMGGVERRERGKGGWRWRWGWRRRTDIFKRGKCVCPPASTSLRYLGDASSIVGSQCGVGWGGVRGGWGRT